MSEKSARKIYAGPSPVASVATAASTAWSRKALIIEDDRETAVFVTQGLSAKGYRCTTVGRGVEGLQKIAAERFDVAIVDIKLPDISGFELIRLIRERSILTPIIVLSSMNTPADKIAGLNCGADDYLGKPFARDELLARLLPLEKVLHDRQQP